MYYTLIQCKGKYGNAYIRFTSESNLQSVIWPWVVESQLQAWFTPPPPHISLIDFFVKEE